ncbi:DUF5752 family protein, partial [Candidatus Altiarchaeota archaeon]
NLVQSLKESTSLYGDGRVDYVFKELDMMPARHENVRRNFSLLAWDNHPREINPGQTVRVAYPLDQVDFNIQDNVRVEFVYGKNSDFLDNRREKTIFIRRSWQRKPVKFAAKEPEVSKPLSCEAMELLGEYESVFFEDGDLASLTAKMLSEKAVEYIFSKLADEGLIDSRSSGPFIFKKDPATILGEARSLEELLDLIRIHPPDPISYHLQGGNDFASWIREGLGKHELAGELEHLDSSDPWEARNQLLDKISEENRQGNIC